VTDQPDLITSREAARLCGVSRTTFNDWARNGTLPEGIRDPASYNGRPRYSRTALEKWLATRP
jgi:predicted site-specific integrase-resolvase